MAEILVSVPATSIAGGTDEIQRDLFREFANHRRPLNPEKAALLLETARGAVSGLSRI